MNHISLVLAYFDNPVQLQRQFALMASIDEKVRRHLEMIVVDDGSPRWPAIPGDPKCPLQMFRMGVNVRWNQDACRNLGAEHARNPWLLLTDMDHLVPESTWRYVVTHELNPSVVYRFGRVSEPELAPYHLHPNSWLMTRTMFLDKIGGYDERFAGLYGSDAPFRDSVQRAAPIIQLKDVLIRVPREVTPDASTPPDVWGRKTPADSEGMARVKREIVESGDLRPQRKGFPWRRVC